MHEVEDSTEDLAVVSIDIAKAFDTVEWNYHLHTLRAMGVGPSLCTWIKFQYTEPTARIKLSKLASDTLQIGREPDRDAICPLCGCSGTHGHMG